MGGLREEKMVSYLFFYWNALISDQACKAPYPSGWRRRTKSSIVQRNAFHKPEKKLLQLNWAYLFYVQAEKKVFCKVLLLGFTLKDKKNSSATLVNFWKWSIHLANFWSSWSPSSKEEQPVSVTVCKGVVAVTSPDCVNDRHLWKHDDGQHNTIVPVVQLVNL